MALSTILPVAVYDLVQEGNLNREFFVKNIKKAKIWARETHFNIWLLEQRKSFPISASTGSGKTVMGLLVGLMRPIRILFLVPKRRLANQPQDLLLAMGGKLRTRIITGETKKTERIWNCKYDRIVFATGQVLLEDEKTNPGIVENFDLVVFDEAHHGRSKTSPYAKIALKAKKAGVSRLGLSASYGTEAQAYQVFTNCHLIDPVNITVPMPKQLGSVLLSTEVSMPTLCKQRFLESFIFDELTQIAERFNQFSKNLQGVAVGIDPQTDINYRALTKLRLKIVNLFPDKSPDDNFDLFDNGSQAGLLASIFAEYAKWAHVYELARTESYAAVEEYYKSSILKSDASFAKRIIKKGRVERLLSLSKNFVHPKLEQLVKILESARRMNQQAITFESNKATARSDYEYLNKIGLSSSLILGGSAMRPKIQDQAVERLKNGFVMNLVSTSVTEEGFDLPIDFIINKTPPTQMISQIQRSGRAGRKGHSAEIIYIAAPEEVPKIYAIDRGIQNSGMSAGSQFEHTVPNLEPNFDRATFQPNLF